MKRLMLADGVLPCSPDQVESLNWELCHVKDPRLRRKILDSCDGKACGNSVGEATEKARSRRPCGLPTG